MLLAMDTHQAALLMAAITQQELDTALAEEWLQAVRVALQSEKPPPAAEDILLVAVASFREETRPLRVVGQEMQRGQEAM